jgi:hypothetical protein
MTTIGRNNPCPCGSGKTFKRCCLAKPEFTIDFEKDYFRLKGENAEKLVHNLAIKSFLTDWCFPNPKLPNGKELCDLLVIFDDIAIIWQIKDLKLNREGKYKRAEVEKNLRQLSGARRQLFDIKTPIDLENPRRGVCKFDPSIIKSIYLVSVLMGDGEEVSSFMEDIKTFRVHVFTREFTQHILNELDTITDFVEYLRTKEEFLSGDRRITILGGEEELMAFYLHQGRSFGRMENADSIMIQGGSWEHLQKKPEYKVRKEADQISYYWDSIINRAHEGGTEYEHVARELARPNRFQRRYLSKTYLDAHVRAHKDDNHDMLRRMMIGEGTTYCFLFQEDPEPRDGRKALLAAMCWIARGQHQLNKKVLGIATEMKIQPTCSYDFCLLEMPEWTDENQNNMEQLQRETGIFVNSMISRTSEDEYPQGNS